MIKKVETLARRMMRDYLNHRSRVLGSKKRYFAMTPALWEEFGPTWMKIAEAEMAFWREREKITKEKVLAEKPVTNAFWKRHKQHIASIQIVTPHE